MMVSRNSPGKMFLIRPRNSPLFRGGIGKSTNNHEPYYGANQKEHTTLRYEPKRHFILFVFVLVPVCSTTFCLCIFFVVKGWREVFEVSAFSPFGFGERRAFLDNLGFGERKKF